MKKQLLAIAFGMLSTFSFGQDFVQAPGNTGFTYIGDNKENAGFTWAIWGPACESGENGGGGFEEAGTNVLDIGWGQSDRGRVYLIFTLTTALDLSTTANQKLAVNLKNTSDAAGTTALPLTYELHLEDASNAQLINPVNLNVTGTTQQFDVDLASNIADGQNLSSVKKIIFIYNSCPSGTAVAGSHLWLSNFKVGSPLNVTSVNAALDNIAKTNVYPNPSNASVNVQLDLKSSSDVKVVLNDLYGKEVMVIAEGNYSSLNENFNVSSLAKGMYTITYILNNTPAKTEMLMVR